MEFILFYLIVGVTFSLAGLALIFFPPKNINGLFGYRTSLSMTDQRYWDFSQKFSGRLLIAMGLLIITTGFILELLDINIKTGVIVGLVLLITTTFLIFFMTEKAIKNKFSVTKKTADR